MQTSGIAGNSAAWALRQLFQPQPNAGQQAAAAGQFLPSSGSVASSNTSASSPQLSAGTLSAITSLQSQQQPPSVSDIASQLIASLDTNGDGSVSLAEAQATGGSNAAQAFSVLDTNGDGNLSSDELSKALQSARPHGHHHHHHGGGSAAGASDAASSLLNALNTDGQDGLSLSEVTTAVGGDASSTAIQNGFSALDSDGNGVLSLQELTSAIQRYQQGQLTQSAQNTAAGLSI